jgi:kynureninase
MSTAAATDSYVNSLEYARAQDAADELKDFRGRFHLPLQADGSPAIYFCGNSLGLQPKAARNYVLQELDDWARLGVEGHLHAHRPWLPYHELLTHMLATLVGAQPAEVVAMNNLTVNLHLLLTSFYRPTPQRYKIVMEQGAFGSDVYAVKSHIKLHGYKPADALVFLKPRADEATLQTGDIEQYFERHGQEVATVLIGGVNYYTGQAFEMARITRAAQAQGCVVGYDLAHAIGNLDLKLHEWNADFAAWCSYKYLNGGPGGTAGIFVHERHARRTDLPRLEGWWGQNKEIRFNMGPDFDPLPGAEGWQLSNPAILPMATLYASLQIFAEATLPRLRRKSEGLTGYLLWLLAQIPTDRISVITPRDAAQRGAQLSIRVRGADKTLYDRITARGVVCDWRAPDVIRVAPVPLYNTFEEAWRFAQILRESL